MFHLFKRKKYVEDEKEKYLKYSFLDNSILLKTKNIEKNGFHEVWRQQNEENSIQILCFNEKTGEFAAFDRFHWKISYGDEDLWTPIKLHFTEKWLRKHLLY